MEQEQFEKKAINVPSFKGKYVYLLIYTFLHDNNQYTTWLALEYALQNFSVKLETLNVISVCNP